MLVDEKREETMVDRLKASLTELDPPVCAKCHVEMRWYMSKLERSEPTAVIVHSFVCPGCAGVRETETEFRAVTVPPDKLLAPRVLARVA